MTDPADSRVTPAPEPTRFALGASVAFTHVLTRDESDVKPYTKTWQEHAREGVGVLVGYRTLANGYTIPGYGGSGPWLEDAEGPEWKQTGSVRAAIVATSLYRRPVFVPPQHLTERTA